MILRTELNETVFYVRHFFGVYIVFLIIIQLHYIIDNWKFQKSGNDVLADILIICSQSKT